MFKLITILSVTFTLLLAAFIAPHPSLEKETSAWNEATPVSEVLATLGEKVADHGVATPTAEMIQQGRELVLNGVTTNANGRTTRRQSKHFVCTHCHNVQQEDPVLNDPNPAARLAFAVEKGLPFLQGTTLHGAVNRTAWYNGDYEKKYGDLVKPARYDLRGAIQLCAVECSQGRALEQWEMDAVVAYLWSLELKMGDLNLSSENWEKLKATAETGESPAEMAKWLKAQYFEASPATFRDTWQSKNKVQALKGDAESGEAIYKLSCQHCHNPYDGVTNFIIDDTQLTRRFLDKHVDKNTKYGLFPIVREGTKPLYGYKPYMPHYTLERMSEQQLADLRAYLGKSL